MFLTMASVLLVRMILTDFIEWRFLYDTPSAVAPAPELPMPTPYASRVRRNFNSSDLPGMQQRLGGKRLGDAERLDALEAEWDAEDAAREAGEAANEQQPNLVVHHEYSNLTVPQRDWHTQSKAALAAQFWSSRTLLSPARPLPKKCVIIVGGTDGSGNAAAGILAQSQSIATENRPGVELRANIQSTLRDCYLIQEAFSRVSTFGRCHLPSCCLQGGRGPVFRLNICLTGQHTTSTPRGGST